MWTWPQLGHRAQIFPFCRSKSIEANPKKTFVQSRDCSFRCSPYIRELDGRGGRRIPGMLAPLLQERVIPLCLFDNLLDRPGVECNSQVAGRLGDRDPGSRWQQGTDLRKVEKSF